MVGQLVGGSIRRRGWTWWSPMSPRPPVPAWWPIVRRPRVEPVTAWSWPSVAYPRFRPKRVWMGPPALPGQFRVERVHRRDADRGIASGVGAGRWSGRPAVVGGVAGIRWRPVRRDEGRAARVDVRSGGRAGQVWSGGECRGAGFIPDTRVLGRVPDRADQRPAGRADTGGAGTPQETASIAVLAQPNPAERSGHAARVGGIGGDIEADMHARTIAPPIAGSARLPSSRPDRRRPRCQHS
jgi:hypothetical protein